MKFVSVLFYLLLISILGYGQDTETNIGGGKHIGSQVSNRPLFTRGLKAYKDATIRFRDTGLIIYSSTDGKLVISSDGSGTDDITFSGTVTGDADWTTTGAFGVNGMNPDAADGATLGTTALEWSDLYLADGGVVFFGDDQDVTLTHIADAALRLNAAIMMEFRDADLSINSSADGQLDIDADTEVEITATTVDLNGILDVSGRINNGVTFWAGAPSPANNDLTIAYFYREDFIGVSYDSLNTELTGVTSKAITGVNANFRGWLFAGNAGAVITSAAGTLGGLVAMTPVTGSNNESYLQLGALGTETFVEYTGSSSKKSWIEFRVATDDITSSAAVFFVGLAEEGSAAADFLNDDGADIADKDVIGFVSWEATEDSIHMIYQTAAGAFGQIVPGIVLTTAMQTFGIQFDGTTTVTFYVDGVSAGTVETDAALFPDTEELSPILAVKNGAQDRILSIDYINLVVER